MSSVGYGPLERIDGPPPIAPLFGLLQAAAAPAAGVRIVPDADDRGIERWMNGAEVYPYPPDTGEAWDPCAPGTEFVEKADGGALKHPQFGALTAVVPITCTTYKVWNQDEYKARAVATLSAIESSIVAREFLTGDRFPVNPHLSDGNGVFPNGDAVTDFPNAIAFLEKEIALTGRQGLIHCSPQLLSAAAARYGWNYWHDAKGNVVRMISGTVIIPDAGYSVGATPTGHAAATGSEEWIYATGPVDVRRTEIFVNPPNVEEAVERGTGGASTGLPNSITYRAERYYLIDWDTELQAAVLCDRCQTDCAP